MPLIDRMHEKHVYSVLDYSVEGKEEEEQFEIALDKTLTIIEFVEEKDAIPFAVFKPTGFGRFELYRKVSEGGISYPGGRRGMEPCCQSL